MEINEYSGLTIKDINKFVEERFTAEFDVRSGGYETEDEAIAAKDQFKKDNFDKFMFDSMESLVYIGNPRSTPANWWWKWSYRTEKVRPFQKNRLSNEGSKVPPTVSELPE